MAKYIRTSYTNTSYIVPGKPYRVTGQFEQMWEVNFEDPGVDLTDYVTIGRPCIHLGLKGEWEIITKYSFDSTEEFEMFRMLYPDYEDKDGRE